MGDRPKLTIAQVVDQFEISRATVRRGIESGRFPSAEKDSHGRWLVPVEDVVAANVKPRKTWINEGGHEPAHAGGHSVHNEHAQGAHTPSVPNDSLVASELAHLKNELAHERAQREALEQVAEERKNHIASLTTALRMLEAAPEKPHRRRWWHRR